MTPWSDPPEAAPPAPIPGPAAVPLSLELPVLGLPTRFRTNHPAVLDAAERAFGAWRGQAVAADAAVHAHPFEVRVEVVPGEEVVDAHGHAPIRWTKEPDGYRVETSGSAGAVDHAARLSWARVTLALMRDREHFRFGMVEALALALLTAFDRTPFHAAGVVGPRRTVLLAGASETGKSTLSYAAVRAGLRILAEDAVFVQRSPRHRVWGFPGHVHLLDDALPGFPELDDATPSVVANGRRKRAVALPAGGPVVAHSAARTAICMLQPGDGPVSLEPLSPDEVVDAVLGRVEEGFSYFRPELAGIARHFAASGGGWRLRLSRNPDDALPFLLRLASAE
jgi:hypothetical protein